jgi:cadmium resistance protein CadD (predicted permease)
MWSTLNTVLLVFGSISVYLSIGDIIMYTKVLRGKQLKGTHWLARHIGMMMGAFIATVTAFVVVNIRFVQPEWIPWLLPTALGVPLMQYWIWKYTRRTTSVKVPVTEKRH